MGIRKTVSSRPQASRETEERRARPSGHDASESVRAVERALDLLFLLGEHQRSLSLQQLAREIGCSKTTVHRLLTTLERREVVEKDPDSRQYRLGRRARDLSRE